MSEIIKYLRKLFAKDDLSFDEVSRVWQITQLGGATPAQIAAFITCLSIKNLSQDELRSTTQYFCNKLIKIANFNLEKSSFSIQTNYQEDFNLKLTIFLISIICAANDIKTIYFYDKILLNIISNFGISPTNELASICLNRLNIAFYNSSLFNYLNKDTIQVLEELDIYSIFNLIKPLLYNTNTQIIKIKNEGDINLYKDFYSNSNKKIWLIYNGNSEKFFDLVNKIVLIDNGKINEFNLNIDKNLDQLDVRSTELNCYNLNKFILGDEIYAHIIIDAILCIGLITGRSDFINIKLEIEDLVRNKHLSNIIKQLVNITSVNSIP